MNFTLAQAAHRIGIDVAALTAMIDRGEIESDVIDGVVVLDWDVADRIRKERLDARSAASSARGRRVTIRQFIAARLIEERDRKRNVGYAPFRAGVLDALTAITNEHTRIKHRVRGEVVEACTTCGQPDEYPTAWPCTTIREVAWIWHSHPDHDIAWAPDGGPWT